jgi:hypothetical protein
MNIFKAKQHQVVNIDDAIEWVRRLRNVGQKVQRRQKGWWVAYYMYGGVTPVPMAEIIIDVTRTTPRGKLITWEHDPKLIEFKRPELKLELPEFDLTKSIIWRYSYNLYGKDDNAGNWLNPVV